MEIISIIVISFLFTITIDLLIKWEINLNKDLFYDIHRKQIEKELKKNERN